jgi:hypothetical protein
MSKVTYALIYGDMPLYSTYIMLQMADQLHRFPEGVARDLRTVCGSRTVEWSLPGVMSD